MVFHHENLLVWFEFEGILDLGDLREILEVFWDFRWEVRKWGALSWWGQHVAWVN